MTKQEEIREGIDKLIGDYCSQILGRKWLAFELTKGLLRYLHSQGVVIKVDRELPKSIMDAVNGDDKFGKREFARLLENWAGYVAVEPLIKEVTNG